ncbi:S26 family signal peptidase [Actinomadura algeriensis]|uniref:Signal peptidase I n=1 Tax=Actinomadura algeriensis TaxID=1679523 RepID=A0ABR9JJE5_9ACTN|nr:S26 family signal peptidase [Actinomadura algeriensis]MBE1530678.1 signal peptidase I [Actinomadura algeriensis]
MIGMSISRGRRAAGLAAGALGTVAAAVAAVGWARGNLVVVTVAGTSMLPTFGDGDRVLVRRRPLRAVRRGDVVVLEPPLGGPYAPGPAGLDGRIWNVKRAAALPGDPLPPGVPGADGTVPPGELAVLGDNPDSVDSRMRGLYSGDRLLGVVVRRLNVARSPAKPPVPWQQAPRSDER